MIRKFYKKGKLGYSYVPFDKDSCLFFNQKFDSIELFVISYMKNKITPVGVRIEKNTIQYDFDTMNRFIRNPINSEQEFYKKGFLKIINITGCDNIALDLVFKKSNKDTSYFKILYEGFIFVMKHEDIEYNSQIIRVSNKVKRMRKIFITTSIMINTDDIYNLNFLKIPGLELEIKYNNNIYIHPILPGKNIIHNTNRTNHLRVNNDNFDPEDIIELEVDILDSLRITLVKLKDRVYCKRYYSEGKQFTLLLNEEFYYGRIRFRLLKTIYHF
jgi:hypothetical protein